MNSTFTLTVRGGGYEARAVVDTREEAEALAATLPKKVKTYIVDTHTIIDGKKCVTKQLVVVAGRLRATKNNARNETGIARLLCLMQNANVEFKPDNFDGHQTLEEALLAYDIEIGA